MSLDPDEVKRILAACEVMQEEINASWRPRQEAGPSRFNLIIPTLIVQGTRRYIEQIAYQINSAYEDANFDACAVMMRRLIETLIIEVYEQRGAQDEIKDDQGHYIELEAMINRLVSQRDFNLSRGAGQAPIRIKRLGDKSAHNRRFLAVRHDIDAIAHDARAIAEELLMLANLR